MKKYDICIIGGGASGMAAAITAKESREDLRVLLIEKKESLGKKVAATGNGRCNITNSGAEMTDVVQEFLTHNGIILRTEDEGRIYPYSGKASHVVKAFEKRLSNLGVDVATGKTVLAVKKDGDVFKIAVEDGSVYEAGKLIIACGGKSSPQFGTTGDGYSWARSLGHEVTRLAPALTNLELDEYDFGGKSVKGVRMKATVTLLRYKEDAKPYEKAVAQEKGEVQFTETGISGICVFNLSRFVRVEEGETIRDLPGKYEVSIDMMPEYNREDVSKIIKKQIDIHGNAETALLTVIDEKLVPVVIRKSGEISAFDSIEDRIACVLQDFRCSVKGAGGWKNAQVTSGGVKITEIDEETMESKIVKDLYFAGEILDYDGPCGGFNLNFAWYTGIKAGKAASR